MQRLANDPDSGPCGIVAAVFRFGMKGGTDHLTCPAAVAFIDIDFYSFNGFFCFFDLQGSYPPICLETTS